MYNFLSIFPGMDNYEEERVIIGSERRAAIKLNEGIRNDHRSGVQYRVKSPIKR